MRLIPKVDRLAGHASLSDAQRRLGERVVMRLCREVVAELRQQALAGVDPPALDQAAERVLERVERLLDSRAQRVINATGVILHTNLGRAPLSPAAAAALARNAAGYTSVEVDLASGRRGARGAFAERALAQLCGAEDALVVNNNAAAVLLVLTALARGRGVVVSRGEQVEIGGGFRVPDVLARSGAEMIEVGTTNRTKLSDYARVLDERDDVAVLLRVHQGNFRQVGFVERPKLSEVSALARERDVLLVKDLGGGALVDLAPLGLAGEPTARACIEAGAHLVCFSCDKVLGGPQGGAIVGDAALVARVRRDPLARAMRLGRLPLVALEATLAAYLQNELDSVPALAAMRRPLEEVRRRVDGWCGCWRAQGIEADAVELDAAVGGGALAEAPLPSVAAAIRGVDIETLARQLRGGEPPIMPRIQDDQLLLDGRTVLADEDEALVDGVLAALASAE